MKKFFVVFRIPIASMDEWVKDTSPETRKEQTQKIMNEWAAWMKKRGGAVVDAGAPLGKTKTVTADGIADTRNDLNYYLFVEAPSHEEAAKLFTDNPHLQIPTSIIEVMEIVSGGM